MASEHLTTMKIPTPPPSESTSASSSPSPGADDTNEFFLSQLTSTDPLSYLLQADSSGTDDASSQGQSPQEWSPFTSWLEATQQEKVPDMGLGSDFNFTMPMDLDFEGSMAIDPSALHFNSSIFTQPETPVFDSNGVFKPEFFTQLLNQNVGRRLSVTSSSSSSGASLSPVLEQRSTPAHSVAGDSTGGEDAVVELAHRVLQAAGITFAVPLDAKLDANESQPKLAIPRLPRPAHAATQSPSRSSPDLSPVAPPAVASTSSTTVLGRPKTSHTTIERRYRTNLNARITGLKQSVPALRVLEARLSGKDSTPTDVVDERGFVDGVKIGRKMSKANVLGKATEYIRVLKRRENRLKREQAGLKSLVGGLVNGPALLHAWETQWRESFGGEEKDEIEEEMGSDDEDGEVEGDDDDDDSGRARKKPRTVKTVKEKPIKTPSVLPVASQTTSLTPGVLPEKRKRGRPRKVPVPTPAPIMPVPVPMDTGLPAYSGRPSGQQYLLAAFAFISFFNSPLTSSAPPYSQPHSHTGAVLNNPMPTHSTSGYGWREFIQIFHLVVSALVFLSIVLPWVPIKYKRTKLASSVTSTLQSVLPASLQSPSPTHNDTAVVVTSERTVGSDRVALLEALSSSSQDSETEGRALRKALGISSGIVGLCQGVVKANKKDRGIELNQLEQRAWVRLGEIVALNDNVSVATRLQTYWGMAWHISTFSASTTDLTTLALIMRPISGTRSCDLWERAGKREILRPYEKLVLESMDVNEAACRLEKWRASPSCNQSFERPSPLGVLAELLIRERIRNHASVLFVKSVDKSLHQRDSESDSDDSDDESYILGDDMQAEDEIKRAQTIQAGRSLGGETADLALSLEKVWEMGTCDLSDVLSSSPTASDGDIKALLSAVVLYRKIFRTSLVCPSGYATGEVPCSVILTPPPSPAQKDGELRLSLRKVLGSSAFETLGGDGHLGLALEHARDSVVDMLVDSRSGRTVVF